LQPPWTLEKVDTARIACDRRRKHMPARRMRRKWRDVTLHVEADRIIVERRPEGDHAGGEDRFLTNPHSPTGRIMTEREIRRVCEAAKDQLVVLDEACIHFSKTDGGMHLAKEYNNHGPPNLLEGLGTGRTAGRLWHLYAGSHRGHDAPEADVEHGSVQVAGAIAALDDDAHVRRRSTKSRVCANSS
jgi:hypothetical protein